MASFRIRAGAAAITGLLILAVIWASDVPKPREYRPSAETTFTGPFEECALPVSPPPASKAKIDNLLVPQVQTGPDTIACEAARARALDARLELEAQLRSALAAENAVLVAERQSRWTVLEFLALIGTLVFAYMTISDGRRHTRAELRAYVMLKPTNIQNFGAGRHPSVAVEIFNTGATPAYAMYYYGSISVLAHPLADPPSKIFALSDPGPRPRYVISKDGKIDGDLYGYETITQEEYAGVKAGTHAIYAIGSVEYLDAFDKSHKTEFCAYVTGENIGSQIPGVPASAITWEFTRLYNDAT